MSEHRIARLRNVLARGGYRGADMDVVRRVTGAAAFLTALVIAVIAPLSPPDGPVAAAVGWSVLCVIVGGFVLLGLRLERTRASARSSTSRCSRAASSAAAASTSTPRR